MKKNSFIAFVFMFVSCVSQEVDTELLLHHAESAYQSEQYTRAINLCDRIISTQKDNLKALKIKSSSYVILEEYEKALPILLDLKSHSENMNDDEFDEMRLDIGLCYIKAENYEEAVKILQECHISEYSENLIACAYYGLGDSENAYKHIKKAVELNPNREEYKESLRLIETEYDTNRNM